MRQAGGAGSWRIPVFWHSLVSISFPLLSSVFITHGTHLDFCFGAIWASMMIPGVILLIETARHINAHSKSEGMARCGFLRLGNTKDLLLLLVASALFLPSAASFWLLFTLAYSPSTTPAAIHLSLPGLLLDNQAGGSRNGAWSLEHSAGSSRLTFPRR
ncbi:hypothetical protein BKA80DRAFT_71067 [Phyllosticta citrichinensis]